LLFVGFPLPSRKVKVLGEELGYGKVSFILLVLATMKLLQKHALLVGTCYCLMFSAKFCILLVELVLYYFNVFVQNSEQFKILLIDGPLVGTATVEVRLYLHVK